MFPSHDRGVGIAGAVLRDLGLGRVDSDSSASIGIKDRLTSGYVDKMQQRLEDAGDDITEEGITARKIEAIKISLAFKMARAALKILCTRYCSFETNGLVTFRFSLNRV